MGKWLYEKPMLLEQTLIMEIIKTPNGFVLTKEMVENSLDTFINAPVVLNINQQIKDYSDKNWYRDNTRVVGYIKGNINIRGNEVFADLLMFTDDWKGKYSNWVITFDANFSNRFVLESIEVH